MRTRHDVPLAPLTTLGVGGPAACLVEVEREDDVVDAVRLAGASDGGCFVLGGGSNVVVADGGFPGVVLRLAMRGVDVRDEGDRVVVDVAAGEDWDAFVERAVGEGWGGVACMSGIPGLVGATPVQNVGAYGEEVGETITAVRAFDRAVARFVDLDAASCAFGYRSSAFKGKDRWIVTRVRFALPKRREAEVRYPELARALAVPEGARVPLALARGAVIALRRAKGMVLDPGDPDTRSAGSFFVNPVVDAALLGAIGASAGAPPPRFAASGEGRYKVPAAWLIERAGFHRGWQHGRVGISGKHALALVNRGGATAAELLDAARIIRRGVWQAFAVRLELEPVVVGGSREEDDL